MEAQHDAESELNGRQRDANEKLVLALLRETHRADSAESGRRVAEDTVRELRDVAEFRERLIGIIGHDLRNPLNAVMMASGLLLQGGRLAPPQEALVNRIGDASRRMKRIVVQVIEFTRARLGGGFVLDRTRTDLGDVCRRVASELRLTSGRNIRVDEMGDGAGMWDSELLGEVFSNLLGNAVEHGLPSAPVVVSVVDNGDHVAVAVSNRGPTISPAMLEHLFEPFHRASSSVESRRTGNLGLGLYIACEIVHAHDGKIQVRSAEGETCFTVWLPRSA